MPARRHSSAPLAAKVAELWLATPQVMALRLSRMALAGHNPSASDRAEMHRMGNEKVVAFSQSWLAMWINWCLLPLRLAPALAQSWGSPHSGHSLQQAMTRASTALLAAGIAPVHRTAVANAKRLARQGAVRRR